MSTDEEQDEAGAIVIRGGLFRQRKKAVQLSAEAPKGGPRLRPLKAARTLALAHHVAAFVESGAVDSYVQAGRAVGMCDARIGQLMKLVSLAPAIQEEVLCVEVTGRGDPVTEQDLLSVATSWIWEKQLETWAPLRERLVPFLRVSGAVAPRGA